MACSDHAPSLYRQWKQQEGLSFYVDASCHPQSIAVLRSRADQLGLELTVGDHRKFDFSGGRVCGVIVQYPNSDGVVEDYSCLIKEAHKNGVSGVDGCRVKSCQVNK